MTLSATELAERASTGILPMFAPSKPIIRELLDYCKHQLTCPYHCKSCTGAAQRAFRAVSAIWLLQTLDISEMKT